MTVLRICVLGFLVCGCGDAPRAVGDGGTGDGGAAADAGLGLLDDAGVHDGAIAPSVDSGPGAELDAGFDADAGQDAGPTPEPPLAGCSSSGEFLRPDILIRAGVFGPDGFTIVGEPFGLPESGARLIRVEPTTGADRWSAPLENGLFVVRDMVRRGPDGLWLVGHQLGEHEPWGNVIAAIDSLGQVAARRFEPQTGSHYPYLEQIRTVPGGTVRVVTIDGRLRELTADLEVSADQTELWSGHLGAGVLGIESAPDGGTVLIMGSAYGGLVRRLAPDGTHEWDREIGVPSRNPKSPSALVSLPGGDVLLLFRGGGGARFTSTGDLLWAQTIAAASSDSRYVSAVAISDTQVLALQATEHGLGAWSDFQVQLIDALAGEVVSTETFGAMTGPRSGTDLSVREGADGYEYAVTGWTRPAGTTQITASFIQFGRCGVHGW